MSLDLRPDHLRMVRDILQKHVPRYAVWAFGSRAKWTAKDYSDLDLCVISDKPLSFSVLGAMAEDFSDSDLPWKVDVVDWATTSESFRKIIERDKVVVQEAGRGGGWAGDGFKRTTFADLISARALEIGDGYRARNEELGGDGLIFLRSGHVTNTHIDFEGVERFHAELEARVRSKLAKPGDAVVTTKGNSTGRTTFVTASMPPFVYSPHLSYWRSKDQTRIEGGFLRYWSKSQEFVDQLVGMKASTDMAPYLSLVDQKRLRISLPPINEQRAIAHILGTLDDKIELNRRMNETLEAMARALFKSWFVDFDPVRAKMNLPSPTGRGAGGEGTPPAPRANTPIPTEFLEFARQLRHHATDAENLLWRLLRGRQIANAKFRRQHAFPPYILDFYCHELKLAVELDGGQHNVDAGQRRDARRDEYLAEHGIRVLRFWNNDVFGNTEGVLEAIYAAVVERSDRVPSPPAPLPEGEGSCGLPQPVADLFPDSFVESELGAIPKGWRVQRFADTVDITGGGTPKTAVTEYWDGDIPWFSVVDAPGNSDVWVVDTAKKITCLGVENSSTRVLPVGTTIISARGTVGRIALVGVPMAMNQSCYGLRGKAGTHGFFTYFATRKLVTSLQQHAHGSVFDTITQDTLAGVSLASPPAELISAFETRVEPVMERIRASLLSSRTLSALRDTLLPKLISGELRVKHAERLIEKASA